jgi:hypothetical protein
MNTALCHALGALAATVFSGQALACYTVYNRANQVIYHAATAPVDMRYPLHQTLPSAFPGGHLVFSVADTACPQVNHTRSAATASRTLDTGMLRQGRAAELALAPGERVILQPARP